MEDRDTQRFVDLSHLIVEGMTTYKGFPGPHICDFWTREESAAFYDDGSSFQIGRIDMIANTGTFSTPLPRYAEGPTLPASSSSRWRRFRAWSSATLGEGLASMSPVRGAERRRQSGTDPTGWDRHWGSDAYFDDLLLTAERPPSWSRAARN